MRPIRVLVVDDSLMFRKLLVQGLNADPNIEVVADVEDVYAARDAILKFKPDVMTLDVEMPKMNGIEFLKRLMPQYPLPVVMISSLNNKVFDALEAGAVDFVNKPSNLTRDQLNDFLSQELAAKVKIASTAKVGKLKRVDNTSVMSHVTPAGGRDRIVAIGASTGGTEAILEVVRHFPAKMPGIVITQHMPPGFTSMYAERLNRICNLEVREAKHGDKIQPGLVLLAPGGLQMRVVRMGSGYAVSCSDGEKVSGHKPSVDVLFDSVAATVRGRAIGVILTGMGADGAAGMLRMRRAGAYTIGQDKESCVVYGMPMEAFKIGAVCMQAPLSSIHHAVMGRLSKA